jgi:hypothetical protein
MVLFSKVGKRLGYIRGTCHRCASLKRSRTFLERSMETGHGSGRKPVTGASRRNLGR